MKRSFIIAITIAISVWLDQWTKILAIDSFKGKPPIIFWKDVFRFQYSENSGGFLSLGSGLSDDVRFWLLTVLVGTFLLGLLGYLFWNKKIDRLNTAALTLVVGGGLSNMIDRVFNEGGRVVDFMNMGIGSLRTGIFNIADMFIMAGMFILLYLMFKESMEERKKNSKKK